MTTLWQASQQLLTGQANPETLTNEALDAIAAESGEGKRVFTKVYAVDAQQQAQQALE